MNLDEKIDKMIEENKDKLINDLAELISYESVLDNATNDAPFGIENARCLNKALEMLNEYGFETKNLDNYCGYGQIGQGEKVIAIAAHLDVVPAGEGWNTNPFNATIKDGKIYGRGTSDDKGAAVASMLALNIINNLGIKLDKRIRLILGCAEETGSDCMKYYVSKEGNFDVGFTPDGDFPCIYGEKGHIRANYIVNNTSLIDISGGTVDNAVCGKCIVKIKENTYNKEALEEYLNNNSISYNITNLDKVDTITVEGVAAHASKPWLGKDAIYYVVSALKHSGYKDNFVDFYIDRFNNENDGKNFGINIEDEYGKLTCVNGKVYIENGKVYGTIDVRVPITLDTSNVVKKLKNINDDRAIIKINKYSNSTYFKPDSKLVTDLLNVYKEVSKDMNSLPITTGGGTYAGSFKNCIAFGCKFQNKENNIHKANEYVDIEDLLLQVKLYVYAILKLLEY